MEKMNVTSAHLYYIQHCLSKNSKGSINSFSDWWRNMEFTPSSDSFYNLIFKVNNNSENTFDKEGKKIVSFLRFYIIMVLIKRMAEDDSFKKKCRDLEERTISTFCENPSVCKKYIYTWFCMVKIAKRENYDFFEAWINDFLLQFGEDNILYKEFGSELSDFYVSHLSEYINDDFTIDEGKFDKFINLFQNYLSFLVAEQKDISRSSKNSSTTLTYIIPLIVDELKEYLASHRNFININQAIFSGSALVDTQSHRVDDTDLNSVDEIVTSSEPDFNIATLAGRVSFIADLFKDTQFSDLITVYEQASALYLNVENNTTDPIKSGWPAWIYVSSIESYVEFRPLFEINNCIDEYFKPNVTSDNKEVLVQLIRENLKALKTNLAQVVPAVPSIAVLPADKMEDTILYYTRPGDTVDSEEICIIDDIRKIKATNPDLAGRITNRLHALHSAGETLEIKPFRNAAVFVKGINNKYKIYVDRNSNIIFTVVNDDSGKSKMIILGADNTLRLACDHAKQIAKSACFENFCSSVCSDPNYSQPVDYADSVTSCCGNSRGEKK